MWLVNTAPTFQLDVGTASVGSVTLTITRAGGTALVTDAATTDNSDGTYDYTLAVGSNDQLDLMRLTWRIVSTGEDIITYEEIVGRLLFTVEEARKFGAKADASSGLTPLESSAEYTERS